MPTLEGWKTISVQGSIEAQMLSAALTDINIPNRIRQDWFGAAYGIAGSNTVGHQGKVLVPDDDFDEALALAKDLFGEQDVT